MKEEILKSSSTGFDPYEYSNDTKSTRELLVMALQMQYELKEIKEVVEVYRKTTRENQSTTHPAEQEVRWLNSEEVCRQLNISERKLQYLRSEKKIKFKADGNRCKYKQEYIDEYIRKHWTKVRKKDDKGLTKIKIGLKKRKAG